jgi:hypothetical protein
MLPLKFITPAERRGSSEFNCSAPLLIKNSTQTCGVRKSRSNIFNIYAPYIQKQTRAVVEIRGNFLTLYVRKEAVGDFNLCNRAGVWRKTHNIKGLTAEHKPQTIQHFTRALVLIFRPAHGRKKHAHASSRAWNIIWGRIFEETISQLCHQISPRLKK